MSLQLMLDLETISKQSNAVITSIGWTTFDFERGLLNSRLILPQVQTQIEFGFHVEFDTIQWWMDQSTEARKASFLAKDSDRVTPEQLHEMLSSIRPFDVWGNGSTFDVTILEHYFRQFGFQPPWDFRGIRDVRTIGALCPNVMKPRPHVAHNALDDSVAQAEYVLACMKELKK